MYHEKCLLKALEIGIFALKIIISGMKSAIVYHTHNHCQMKIKDTDRKYNELAETFFFCFFSEKLLDLVEL